MSTEQGLRNVSLKPASRLNFLLPVPLGSPFSHLLKSEFLLNDGTVFKIIIYEQKENDPAKSPKMGGGATQPVERIFCVFKG
jgi:hypothetical protein